MFNPFAALSEPLLNAFVRSGKRYFVRQTYTRASPLPMEGIKGCFLFTHYESIAHAQHHYGAISHDVAKYIYTWDNAGDKQRLIVAAGNPGGYKIYSSVFIKNWEQEITGKIKEKVKKYIDNTLAWIPGGDETVDFNIYVDYGELYAKLKLRKQEVRVKLEHIENG